MQASESYLQIFRDSPVEGVTIVLCFFAIYAPLMWLMFRRLTKRRRRKLAGLCPSCGYDLTGNVSGTCPECGGKVG